MIFSLCLTIIGLGTFFSINQSMVLLLLGATYLINEKCKRDNYLGSGFISLKLELKSLNMRFKISPKF